jgi:hypothetical protein
LISLAKLFLPAVLKVKHGDLRMEIVGKGVDRFNTLKGKRVIICPNHPSFDDTDILFAFSRLVGENLNFLTAWELFHGPGGYHKWLQYLGCFSIVRGAPDYASFKATRDLLVEGKRKIVIFPEGEISHENDFLLPLKPGAVQIAFSAMERLEHMGSDEPVFILPLALKYVYRCDIHAVLDQAIGKLERELELPTNDQESLYERIRHVGLSVLAGLEYEYNCKPADTCSLNERIAALRATILREVASSLQVELPQGGTHLEWAHYLQSVVYDLRYGEDSEGEEKIKYLSDERAQQLRSLSRDLHRVVNFIAIYEDYIRDPATQEKIAEVVGLFEQELFGSPSLKGPRSVLIDIGVPINIAELYPAYKRARASTVRNVVHILTMELSQMLQDLDAHRTPIYVARQPGS